ncbi:MAG: T9SS type A sorting domain-containing protein [Bacteroidales bacterium]|nr:T9SS type A sorting domain-containing protein [Bacteroidales bacterium]
MKALFTSFLLLTILLAVNIQAQHVQLSAEQNELQITERHKDQLQISNSIASFSIEKTRLKNTGFFTLNLPAYSRSFDIGHPQLPVQTKLIEIPFNATPEISIIDTSSAIYNLKDWDVTKKLKPVHPPVAKNGKAQQSVQLKNKIYNRDEYYQKPLVSIEVLGVMRDKRLARIVISPFQYNPVTSELNIYKEIDFKIHFKEADHRQTLKHKQRYQHPYSEANNDRLLNASSLDTITQYPIKYLIVSDPMFEDMLQPFIQWKTRKGFKVIDVYTDNPEVGNTPESIKAFLQEHYEESEEPHSFILLVGDDDQIPSFTAGSSDHYADFYFGEYTGDLLPDAYVGRFSAKDPGQLQPQIDKTLQYEQYTFPDASFLDEAVMIAGVDSQYGPVHGNGQMNYATDYYFNEDHDITSYTYLYPESGQSDEEIIFHVSQGVGFVNYTAHGNALGWSDPAFSVQDIDDLNNTDEYPLMIGNGCSTNEFSVDACFGEALLRAENKGAMGYIGASNDTYWDEDYYWSVGLASEITENPTYEETGLGAYDRWYHDHGEPQSEWYTTMAQMQVAGNLAVTESGSPLEQYYWEVYHLMGDPSLMVYFSQPQPISMAHDTTIPIGVDHFEVTTEPNTYVALSADGVLHGAAMAGQDGIAEIEINPFLTEADVELVATAQNRQPYIDTLSAITPQGPYVLYADAVINDETGNNNQKADYGETIRIDITFKNVGNKSSDSATAIISANDQYITINDSSEQNLSIQPGESLMIEDAFEISVADSIPDERTVQLILEVSQNDTVWNSSFTITLHAPVLEVTEWIINDVNGNDNGRLEAGEVAELRVINENTGSSYATGLQASLECNSLYLSIDDGYIAPGNFHPGEMRTAIYTVAVDEEAPLGENLDFLYELNAGSYSAIMEQTEIIGILDEDFETGDFSKYDWQTAGDSAWMIDESNAYEGSFSARSDEIGHGRTSGLRIEVKVLEDGPLTFFRKVSSEEDYDWLRFYIDGEKMDEWSGVKNWEQFEYPLAKGEHTLKWVYEKDATVNENLDATWIDYIVFPPMKNSLNVEEIRADSLKFSIYPNPAVNQVNFDLQMPVRDFVTLELYTMQGIKLETLLQEEVIVQKKIGMNISQLKSGIYVAVLTYGDRRIVKKLVVSQ